MVSNSSRQAGECFRKSHLSSWTEGVAKSLFIYKIRQYQMRDTNIGYGRGREHKTRMKARNYKTYLMVKFRWTKVGFLKSQTDRIAGVMRTLTEQLVAWLLHCKWLPLHTNIPKCKGKVTRRKRTRGEYRTRKGLQLWKRRKYMLLKE